MNCACLSIASTNPTGYAYLSDDRPVSRLRSELMRKIVLSGLLIALTVCCCRVAAADNSAAIDPQLLKQLQETIRLQQLQLQQQAEQIQRQGIQLQHLQQQVSGLIQQTATPQPAAVQQARPEVVQQMPGLHIVKSGNDKINLTLSGQINRALNVVADGAETNLYHVDNNVSNSRLRLLGSAELNSDITLNTRLELAFAADESSKVSQKEPAPGNYFNTRWVDVSLASRRYGKLSMGKGNTASYFTASSDLSKTDIVLYSSVADIAGGILFRKKNGQLSDRSLADVFTDYDGLNAKSRLRYDTPEWHGIKVAGSLVSNRRSDIGIYWEGDGYGLQTTAGFGIANPQLDDSGLQYDGSLALLHTASGLNVTLSGGMLEKTSDKNAFSFYGKLGWLAQLTSLGSTAFGMDLSRSDNSFAPGDRGTSVGAAVVQDFKKVAAEVYLQYRVYSLKMGDGTPVYDINVGTLGVRVKF